MNWDQFLQCVLLGTAAFGAGWALAAWIRSKGKIDND